MKLLPNIYQGRNGLPAPPVEVADEVELYAREYGRTATLHFIPTSGWMVRFSLRCNDPRVQLFQQGEMGEPPTEDVWLHEPNPRGGQPDGRGGREPTYLPLDIYQLGASGVRQFLERGNTWGRGQHESIESLVTTVRETEQAATEKLRATLKEENRHEQRDKRRWRFKIPFLPVGISFGKEQSSSPSAPPA